MALINRKYPHLLPVDVPVWERFLAANGDNFDRIEYDLHVGNGLDPGTAWPENYRQMGIQLTQKRIDAVAYTQGSIWVIEITRRCGVKAIGQALCYPILYRHSFPTLSTIIPTIVCEELITDIDIVIQALDLNIFILPPLPT